FGIDGHLTVVCHVKNNASTLVMLTRSCACNTHREPVGCIENDYRDKGKDHRLADDLRKPGASRWPSSSGERFAIPFRMPRPRPGCDMPVSSKRAIRTRSNRSMKSSMARRTEAYIDTSAMMAFLDRSDSHHSFFRRLFAD